MRGAERNIALYPWFRFFQSLLFWQAIWFLYFQQTLSAAEAILLYAIYDLATTILEVPSGWVSDRFGRRLTLIASAVAAILGALTLAFGGSFAMFVFGQVCLGASAAFTSGTDTAFLYESLEDAGQTDRVEAEELRAWRFGFTGFAVSAFAGGAMSLAGFTYPFLASAMAQGGVLLIALSFVEPEGRRDDIDMGGEWTRVASLRTALLNPVLMWLFALSVLMYGYSHIPFVFGQPFIQEALADWSLAAQAPVVSGAVTTVMMLVSVGVSLIAPAIRRRLGLAGVLLLAFGLQIGIAAVLAATKSVAAIAVLFLRMVPSSLSAPFILARIQPELSDDSRATYLSLKSLTGRVLFAASLWVAAGATGGVGEMPYEEMRPILAAYASVGFVALVVLAIAARKLALDGPQDAQAGEKEG